MLMTLHMKQMEWRTVTWRVALNLPKGFLFRIPGQVTARITHLSFIPVPLWLIPHSLFRLPSIPFKKCLRPSNRTIIILIDCPNIKPRNRPLIGGGVGTFLPKAIYLHSSLFASSSIWKNVNSRPPTSSWIKLTVHVQVITYDSCILSIIGWFQ